MKHDVENDYLVIQLEGRIDSENATDIETDIHSLLENHPGDYILDAENLEYISSAGLRVLLRLMKSDRAPLILRNASPEVYEILDITGFTSLISVKRRIRKISIAGCPEIGHGAIGKVYRIDPDTIVKVYNSNVSLESIETEQQRAKQAFLKGIPTAITFEIVRVGEQYGAVFELLKAENCNDMLVRSPERSESIIHDYVNLMKTVHHVVMEPGELPDCRDVYRDYLEQLSSVLPQNITDRIKSLICAMQEDLHAVHGDFHMKNVLFSDGEPMLIDMETLSTGNPVFDFAGLFVTYKAFNEDEPSNTEDFFGIGKELCDALYYRILKLYLDTDNEVAVSKAEDQISVLGYVRFLYMMNVLDIGRPDLRETRTKHSIEHLQSLLERVTCLEI